MNRTIFGMKVNNKLQKFIHSDVRQSTTKKILSSLVAIFIAFLLAFIIACTVCGAWEKAGDVWATFFTAGFQPQFINTLLSNMCILIVGGLAFIFAYKAGLFNIGISGQMVAGGTVGTIICHMCHIPAGANQVVVIIASMATAALMAGLVGAMKAYLRVNEVVSSIMFNWIIYFMSIMTLGMLPIEHDASNLNTKAPADELLLRMGVNSYWPLIIISIILIFLIIVILRYTVFGKKQKATGLSNTGALAAGYNIKANMISSMAISGAIAGVLGAMLYCGFSPNMPVTAAAKAIPQEGFNGISVGLISMCNPLAAVPVSLFFSMVKTAVSDLQMLGIDNHIADVVFGIVVYGAAAIALFLNLKPYWLTLDIVKGKNFSKITHERNMTNIELLSISSDHCSVLKKYFVFYQKTTKVKSTLKLSPLIKMKMWWADIRYWFTTQHAKYNVWYNKRRDLLTGKYRYRQEMVHLVKLGHQVVVDKDQVKRRGWYILIDDKRLADPQLLEYVQNGTDSVVGPNVLRDFKELNERFKAKPFSDRNIRLLPKLAYLQNKRSGLSYRNAISKQNKLAYFTLVQTREQAEAVGLNEIRSKKQYNFARTAYFKAYQKTFDLVKAHYDMMEKTFTRDKQLNIYGVRFDSATLYKLYINNLKAEIASIAHLINCPLTKAQLNDVSNLITKENDLESKVHSDIKLSASYRQAAKNYLNKSQKVNNNIIKERSEVQKTKAKIAVIVKQAKVNEQRLQREKWLARKKANELAEKKLAKLAQKRAKKGI